MKAKSPTAVFELIQNALLTRQKWLSALLDPRRDIDKECGHPETISIDDYNRAYSRGDLATRVVDVYPEESWADDPMVFETEDPEETEFEKAWDTLQKRFSLFSLLQRADMLSGIGRFGVILLGVDDGQDLSQPVDGINERGEKIGGTSAERELLYVRPFDETIVTIQAFETDSQNPRYGLPTKYEIQFTSDGTLASDRMVLSVHWSRVVHIADNRRNSEVYGIPRMQRVFNRLLDLKKISGGSGEMFWKGGFPGFSLETMPDKGETVVLDKVATKEQMESYMNGLQRYIATIGMSVKSLAPQIADPESHIDTQIKLVAAAMGIPWRVLIGSEQAQLASGQDKKTWNSRVNRRRIAYLTPYVLTPFIKRLIDVGILPEPGEEGFQVEWKDLNTPSNEEKAGVAERRSNALSKYVQGGVDTLILPFHYLTLVLGFSDEEANAIIEAAGDDLLAVDRNEEDEEEEPVEARGNGIPARR